MTEGEEEKVVELLKMLSESVSESSDEEEADNDKNDDDEKRDDNDKKDDEISNKSDNEDDNIRNQADKMQNIVVISDSEDEWIFCISLKDGSEVNTTFCINKLCFILHRQSIEINCSLSSPEQKWSSMIMMSYFKANAF